MNRMPDIEFRRGALPAAGQPIGVQLQRRVRLLGLLSVFALVVVITGSTLLAVRQLEQAVLEARQSARFLVDEFVLDVLAHTETAADLLAVAGGDEKLFRAILGRDRVVKGIYLVDRDGQVLVQQHIPGQPGREAFAEQPWLERFAQQLPYIGQPFFAGQLLPELLIAQPVPDTGGEVLHSLVAHIDISGLWAQINRIRLGDSGIVYLVTADGRLIFHRKPRLLSQQARIQDLLRIGDDWADIGGMRLVQRSDDALVLVSTGRLPETGWVIVTEYPLSDIKGWILAALLILLGGLAMTLLIVRRVDLFTREVIVRPLDQLHRAVMAFEQGDLGHRVGDIGRHELGDLGQVLDKMADRLGRSLEGLNTRVDELKRSQRALQESEAKFRTIFEGSSDAILIIDPQQGFVEANGTACARLGYRREQLLALAPKQIDRRFSPEGIAELQHELRARREAMFETRHSTGNGHEIEVEICARPLDYGGVHCIICVARDISARKEAERVLRQYQHVVSATQDLVSLIDDRYVYRLVNRAYLQAFGVAYEEIVGRSVSSLLGREDFAAVIKPHLDRCLSGETVRYQHWFDYPRLGRRYMDMVYSPYVAQDREIRGVVVSIRDITEGFKAQQQLELAASVFTHAREGILMTDIAGLVVDVNDAFSRITGLAKQEVLGKPLGAFYPDQEALGGTEQMQRLLAERGYWSGEVWHRRPDGETYVVMATVSAVCDAAGIVKHYVVLLYDITDQKQYQQQLEHIAHYDALTGLPNRLLLADRLHQAMAQVNRRRQRLAVTYLDLDGFKEINDSYGHDVGDQLLQNVSSRMRECLREGDTIARIGGDEFVAVLIDLGEASIYAPLLQRLLNAASSPIFVGERRLQVTASLGVTFYPQGDELEADQLLRQADQAMYQAKLAGKNRYKVFDTEQDRTLRGVNRDRQAIRDALRRHQFVLHYQPKVNMRTGEVMGVEALIRWQHPERGLLPPAEFLPLIEQDPLAIELGEWVIATALEQLERWQAEGLDLSVSVNVGTHQLQQRDFVERLQSLLSAHPGIGTGRLEFEVLETAALEDMTQVSQVMRSCRDIEVRFALDDFGTGYSTLAYLKHLPAGQLKIDRGFVRDLLENPDDLTILDGILGLAAAFGREVIAEGVETEAQGQLLLQLGCEQAQGYGIARPMPGERLPAWVRDWRPCADWTRQQPLPREGRALIYAMVEHRAWIRAVTAALRDSGWLPPAQASDKCRLGHWLRHEGRRYEQQSLLAEIDALHREVHDQVAALIQLREQGRMEEARAGLPALELGRDQLLALLQRLLSEHTAYAAVGG